MNLLSVLWSLCSVKALLMFLMFFFPSMAMSPVMYVEKFLYWGLLNTGLNSFRSCFMTPVDCGTSMGYRSLFRWWFNDKKSFNLNFAKLQLIILLT